MQKVRELISSIGKYNLTLLGLVFTFVIAVIGANLHWHPSILGLAAVTATGCFISMLFQQRHNNQVSRVNIKEAWQVMVKSIKDTQLYAMRKLSTCPDQALVEQVVDKLMDAASHMGSNPDWRNPHRITTSGDIISWYQQGKSKADEARALVDGYVAKNPYAGGLGDVHH